MIITRKITILNIIHNMIFPSLILTMQKKKCIFSLQGRFLSPVPHSSNLLINSTTACMSWIIAVMRRMLARRFSLPFFFFFPIGISSFPVSLFLCYKYIIPLVTNRVNTLCDIFIYFFHITWYSLDKEMEGCKWEIFNLF